MKEKKTLKTISPMNLNQPLQFSEQKVTCDRTNQQEKNSNQSFREKGQKCHCWRGEKKSLLTLQ